MTPNRFTAPDDSDDEWVDVRMRDPEEGEWDVDAVVADGRVQYLDLRVNPGVLAGFVGCLLDDVGSRRAGRILAQVAERAGVDPADVAGDTDAARDSAAEAEDSDDPVDDADGQS